MIYEAGKNSPSTHVKKSVVLPKTSRIVLGGKDTQSLFEQEVRNVEITGTLKASRTAPVCNVIESAFTSFTADSVDFTRCDFKDDVFRSAHFLRCSFTSASMLFDAVFQSSFEESSFHDTVVQDCEFHDVNFLGCDLSHIIVKACTFNRCHFRNCTTSNKVFEMCRFGECVFENTELQVDTLAENFGLTATSYSGTLRDGRKDYAHRQIAKKDLADWLRSSDARPLHKFNVDYFLRGTLLDGSLYWDTSVNIASWAPLLRTAGSFVLALNQWVAFAIWLYERDSIMIHSVLSLHSMTGELLNRLDNNASNHQLVAGISGAHLSLARVVEEYLLVLEQCKTRTHSQAVLLVEGGDSKEFYSRSLSILLTRADARIASLKPHNSPWDLVVGFTSHSNVLVFLALFLATRTRIELFRIGKNIAEPTSQSTQGIPKQLTSGKQVRGHNAEQARALVTLEFGGNVPIGINPSLKLRAYLPGDLMAELKLNVKSQKLAKLRKVLAGLLSLA